MTVSSATATTMREEYSKNEIMAYPNPVSEKLSINSREPSEIFIYNSIGELAGRDNLVEGKNEINLSGLPQGIYFLTFTERKLRRTIKIIKQ